MSEPWPWTGTVHHSSQLPPPLGSAVPPLPLGKATL